MKMGMPESVPETGQYATVTSMLCRLAVAWSLLCVAACNVPDPAPAAGTASLAGPERSAAPAWGPPPPAHQDAALVAAELARDPKSLAIETGLASTELLVRESAAWSLARIGGPEARDRLRPLLDGDAGASASMFAALGLLDPPRHAPREAPEPDGPWADLEDAVWNRYAVTEKLDEAQALLFSVARLGGTRSMIRLAADLAPRPAPAELPRYAAAMEATGILCARGHALTARGLEAVAQGLDLTDPEARKSAVYALGRCAGPSAELLAGERGKVLARRLAGLAAGTDAETARLTWKALASLGHPPPRPPDLGTAAAPLPWVVAVEAARAMVMTDNGRTALVHRLAEDLPEWVFRPPYVHFVHATLRGLRPHANRTPGLVPAVRALLPRLDAFETTQSDRRRALTMTRCELLALVAIVEGALEELTVCAGRDALPPAFVDGLVVEVLLHMGEAMPHNERVERLLARAGDVAPTRAVPALSALAELEDARVNESLRRALEHDDVGMVSAAAGAIAARSLDATKRDPEAVAGLLAAAERLTSEAAVEARVVAIEALGRLARTAPDPAPTDPTDPTEPTTVASAAPWVARIQALSADPAVAVRRAARDALLGHPAPLSAFDRVASTSPKNPFSGWSRDPENKPGAGLRLHTSRGIIEVEGYAGVAPLNRENLARLARSGYFDGLAFHRVVAGFVAQGGDPRGDGYGGPGHLVPCEWSNLRFVRGTVGIALAGKDTGGSQFFIAQTPQPHLDGRYTIVGRVVEGMEVVDRLLAHDRIERVEVLE